MKRISIAAVILSTIFVMSAAAQTPAAPKPATPAAPAQTPAPKPAAPAAAAPALPTPPVVVPFPADSKIAFIDMQVLVAESKLGKAGSDQMKALHDKNAKALDVKVKAAQDLQQKMNSQGPVVSDATAQQMKRDLDRLQLDAQTTQQQYTADEQNLNDDLLNNFSEKAQPIIDALRIEKGLWVIFGVQQGQGSVLVPASINAGLDLSMEVVKRMDAAAK